MGYGDQQSFQQSVPWTSKRHGRSQITQRSLVVAIVSGLALMPYMSAGMRTWISFSSISTGNATKLDNPVMIWKKVSRVLKPVYLV